MARNTQDIEWKTSAADAAVEDEPRVSIEARQPFMVGGVMAVKGMRVKNVPDHMARSLVSRGRAQVLADGA